MLAGPLIFVGQALTSFSDCKSYAREPVVGQALAICSDCKFYARKAVVGQALASFFGLQVLMLAKSEPPGTLNAKQTEQTSPRRM